jgi:hypothetical protein
MEKFAILINALVHIQPLSDSRMERAIAIFTAATARSYCPNHERNCRFPRPTPRCSSLGG